MFSFYIWRTSDPFQVLTDYENILPHESKIYTYKKLIEVKASLYEELLDKISVLTKKYPDDTIGLIIDVFGFLNCLRDRMFQKHILKVLKDNKVGLILKTHYISFRNEVEVLELLGHYSGLSSEQFSSDYVFSETFGDKLTISMGAIVHNPSISEDTTLHKSAFSNIRRVKSDSILGSIVKHVKKDVLARRKVKLKQDLKQIIFCDDTSINILERDIQGMSYERSPESLEGVRTYKKKFKTFYSIISIWTYPDPEKIIKYPSAKVDKIHYMMNDMSIISNGILCNMQCPLDTRINIYLSSNRARQYGERDTKYNLDYKNI